MDVQKSYSDTNLQLATPRLRPAAISPDTARYVQKRVGRAIRIRRRMLDLTLQDLASACGVTFQQVHKYESGLCGLSASQLWAIAVALEVPIGYFFDGLLAPDAWRPDVAANT